MDNKLAQIAPVVIVKVAKQKTKTDILLRRVIPSKCNTSAECVLGEVKKRARHFEIKGHPVTYSTSFYLNYVFVLLCVLYVTDAVLTD